METAEGLLYVPDLISEEEERQVLGKLAQLDFREIRMHGVVAKRTARHFGLDYDYDRRAVVDEVDPVPEWLLPIRTAAASMADLPPDDLVEVLVQRYPEGAQIGWHRDAPMFDQVLGVSLLSPARMRFRRGPAKDRKQFELTLAPRSGYVLSGESRRKWEHHIPPAKSLRYSITFRTIRGDS